MNKRIKVLVSAVLAVVMLVLCIPFTAAAAGETKSIAANAGSLSGKTITWTSTNFTMVVEQGSNNNAIRTQDSDHFRVYQGNNVTINALNGKTISQIVITLTGTSYVTPLQNSKPSNATASVSGSVVTLTFANPVSTVTMTAAAQWRLNKIEVVFYEAGAACTHAYDNCADAECNLCSEPRTAGTCQYTNEYDASCNKCAASRTVTLPAADSVLDIPTAVAIGLAQDSKTSNKYYVEGVTGGAVKG